MSRVADNVVEELIMVKGKAKSETPVEPIRIMGDLDRAKDDVDRLVAASESDIVLDFSACTFISVEGVEWLEEIAIRAESKSVNVRFENIPPSIYKVFKISHVDCILKACGAPSTALGPTC